MWRAPAVCDVGAVKCHSAVLHVGGRSSPMCTKLASMWPPPARTASATPSVVVRFVPTWSRPRACAVAAPFSKWARVASTEWASVPLALAPASTRRDVRSVLKRGSGAGCVLSSPSCTFAWTLCACAACKRPSCGMLNRLAISRSPTSASPCALTTRIAETWLCVSRRVCSSSSGRVGRPAPDATRPPRAA